MQLLPCGLPAVMPCHHGDAAVQYTCWLHKMPPDHVCCLIAAKKYSAFLASETVIKQIPRLLGPGLNKAGKFPALVSHNESLEAKASSCCATALFCVSRIHADTSSIDLELSRTVQCSWQQSGQTTCCYSSSIDQGLGPPAAFLLVLKRWYMARKTQSR